MSLCVCVCVCVCVCGLGVCDVSLVYLHGSVVARLSKLVLPAADAQVCLLMQPSCRLAAAITSFIKSQERETIPRLYFPASRHFFFSLLPILKKNCLQPVLISIYI